MRPRFVGRVGLADVFTTLNAALGFVAVVGTTVSVGLAARLILLAAIADAIDGIIAKRYGGTQVGPFLDSLADVASFGVAPALLVVVAIRGVDSFAGTAVEYLGIAVGALFVAMAVVRLALYTAYDTDEPWTEGVQTTLAATLIAAGTLSGVGPVWLLAGIGVFVILMVTPITYPDLRVRDAIVMGAVQALAIALPTTWSSLFPRVLLAWALGYLFLGPWVYPRAEGKRS